MRKKKIPETMEIRRKIIQVEMIEIQDRTYEITDERKMTLEMKMGELIVTREMIMTREVIELIERIELMSERGQLMNEVSEILEEMMT